MQYAAIRVVAQMTVATLYQWIKCDSTCKSSFVLALVRMYIYLHELCARCALHAYVNMYRGSTGLYCKLRREPGISISSL